MTEEKTPKETPQPKEAPKKETQEKKPEPPKAAPQPKAAPEKKQPEVVEKPTNCMKCNKRLQRKVWYYRDNGYYCSKRCWKLAVEAKVKKEDKTKKEA